MRERVEVTAPGAEATFRRWLKRGDTIATFRNMDLGHPEVGHEIFLPLDHKEVEQAVMGRTHAPDSPTYGLGWRYRLAMLSDDIRDFEFAVPQGEG